MKQLLNVTILEQAKREEIRMNDLLSSEDTTKFIKYVIKTYVKSPAKFMLYNRVEFSELMHLGTIGLYKGIKDLDLTKNEKEIQRYLYLRVQGEIREVARSNNSNQIVVSQRIRGLYTKYLQYHTGFYSTNYRDPTIKEVMSQFSISEEDAYDLVYGLQAVISDTAEADGQLSLLDILGTKYFNINSGVETQVINKLILEEKLCLLKGKERRVLELKYLLGYKNSEIARLISCSNAMVTKHLANAFKRFEVAVPKN